MKKNQIILLILCIACFAINITYILFLSDTGKILGLIQYLAIYIPFFVLLFIKNKKYAMYICLAFCGFELLVSIFEYINYIRIFINNDVIANISEIIISLAIKIFSNIIKVLLIINIINWLNEKDKKYISLINIMVVFLLVGSFYYMFPVGLSLQSKIALIKDVILTILLVYFVITNFSLELNKDSTIE